MQKSKRIYTAKKTLTALQDGCYVNKLGKRIDLRTYQKYAETQTRLFLPKDLDTLLQSTDIQRKFITQFEVTGESSLEAVNRLYNLTHQDMMCLNFASAKNPGGGFLNGAKAQEESIAMASGLYNCLLKAPEYYSYHRNLQTCLYSDHMIYSPRVPVFKDDEGEVLDQVIPVSIITSPAVNAGVIKRNEPEHIMLIEPVMEKRIRKMLLIAYLNHLNILVLGAWGCGVFQNNPEDVARLFYQVLATEFYGVFEKVVFAIKSKEDRFITPFQEYFMQRTNS